ncbi:MAG: hypothetical protein ACXWRE_11000, partial [Pseudobdellovibrionaceae bacterium]
HVGEAHYNQALGEEFPNASFFVSFEQGSNSRTSKNKKPSEGLPPEGFNFVSAEENSKNQASHFLRCDRSRRLTSGGPDQG